MNITDFLQTCAGYAAAGFHFASAKAVAPIAWVQLLFSFPVKHDVSGHINGLITAAGLLFASMNFFMTAFRNSIEKIDHAAAATAIVVTKAPNASDTDLASAYDGITRELTATYREATEFQARFDGLHRESKNVAVQFCMVMLLKGADSLLPVDEFDHRYVLFVAVPIACWMAFVPLRVCDQLARAKSLERKFTHAKSNYDTHRDILAKFNGA